MNTGVPPESQEQHEVRSRESKATQPSLISLPLVKASSHLPPVQVRHAQEETALRIFLNLQPCRKVNPVDYIEFDCLPLLLYTFTFFILKSVLLPSEHCIAQPFHESARVGKSQKSLHCMGESSSFGLPFSPLKRVQSHLNK